MKKGDFDFDTWYGVLNAQVLDRTGVDFKDEEAAREDYDKGLDVYDVIEEIVLEYGED